jgi:hypothetical protein
MINRPLGDAFEEAYERKQQGEPIDAIIADYPAVADELRTLLKVTELPSRAQPPHSEIADVRTRLDSTFQQQLEAAPVRQSGNSTGRRLTGLLGLAAALVGLLALMAVFGGEVVLPPTATATQTASPTATITVSPTQTPSPTVTATMTVTMTDIPATTPAPTATVTPLPASDTPVPATSAPSLAPTSVPAGDECQINPPDDWVMYVVQTGDTLSSIAVRTGIDDDSLARVNCIENAALIRQGQSLFVPRPPASDTGDDTDNSGQTSDDSTGDNDEEDYDDYDDYEDNYDDYDDYDDNYDDYDDYDD